MGVKRGAACACTTLALHGSRGDMQTTMWRSCTEDGDTKAVQTQQAGTAAARML